ncbi:response regulator [Paenibacillus mendelii]|uniref:Response regulator n=1 Tax=Paenibacillus mendelii TaxID=206163 RepID=A0ABV6JG15_9BACL|nr:response regulator [Paenibacillus mendelii]MCQ6557742.1 response regulator [Paenibacillus mendelii]
MRKVMIVDDESLVRIGLQSIIEWELRGYHIAGVFKSGEEAVAAARQQAFDVVLTDIRMPGMDGLALIRELKLIDPQLKFIILSSYNDFDYMRQAIQLGVKDYISKYEMEPEELLRVLDSLQFTEPSAASGDQNEKQDQVREEAERLLEEKQQLLKQTAGERLFRAASDYPAISGRFDRWGDTVRWICLRPIPRDVLYSQAELKAMALQAEEIFRRLKHMEFIGEDSGFIHGICVVSAADSLKEGLWGLQQMAEELKAAWAKNLNIGLIAGISSSAPFTRMGQLRHEAEEAASLSFYHGAGIYVREEYDLGIIAEQEWLEWYKRIKNRIQYLNFTELTDELEARLEDPGTRWYPSEWLRVGETVAVQLTDLLIERYDLDIDQIRSRFGSLWPLPEAMKRVRSHHEFMAVIYDMTAKTQDTIASIQTSRGWVLVVKKYVESFYGEPIRLEEMAEKVNFSANHFSQRFRQETGESFSDYVVRIRIREAIRMYRETDYSTEEIAARVGYTNPNYFIKVFKKATGQTVKQFKQRF